MNRADIYSLIDAERTRQHQLWDGAHSWGVGDCSHPDLEPTVKVTVLAEECGEVSRAVLDRNPAQLRAELVQLAAVCVAWLETP